MKVYQKYEAAVRRKKKLVEELTEKIRC
jgi:hypothetical protein